MTTEILGIHHVAEVLSCEVGGIEVRSLIEALFVVIVAVLGVWKGVKLTIRVMAATARTVSRAALWCVGVVHREPDEIETAVVAALADHAGYDEKTVALVAGSVTATLMRSGEVSVRVGGNYVESRLSGRARRAIYRLIMAAKSEHETLSAALERERILGEIRGMGGPGCLPANVAVPMATPLKV